MTWNHKLWTVLCGATLLIVAFPFAAADNLATNGSFETGPALGPAGYTQVDAPSSAIDGWTVVSGSVDVVGYFADADGSRSLDLSGVAPGTIEQSIPTLAGATYLIRFAMAANPTGSTIKTLRASAAGSEGTFEFNRTGRSVASMGWVEREVAFVATASSTTLRFESLTDGNAGPALDDVRVDLAAAPPPNQPPVADAGPDQTVDEGTLVTLAGSASDPDGDGLKVFWTQVDGPPVTLSAENTLTPTFTAPSVPADTNLTFRLDAEDSLDAASDTVVVRVVDLPVPPPPDTGFCPRGQGYWKNHADAWPVDSLVLGDTTFTKAQAIDVLRTPPQGDARLILAKQLIAAKLNLAAGATDVLAADGDPISEHVEGADFRLDEDGRGLFHRNDRVATSSASGKRMLAYADLFESFNDDELTPGC